MTAATIFCLKLQKEAEALARAPLPGALGEKILTHISAQAWSLWINHQTMLINENRLSLINPEARTFLLQEMDKFLFGKGSAPPAGYVPEDNKKII